MLSPHIYFLSHQGPRSPSYEQPPPSPLGYIVFEALNNYGANQRPSTTTISSQRLVSDWAGDPVLAIRKKCLGASSKSLIPKKVAAPFLLRCSTGKRKPSSSLKGALVQSERQSRKKRTYASILMTLFTAESRRSLFDLRTSKYVR